MTKSPNRRASVELGSRARLRPFHVAVSAEAFAAAQFARAGLDVSVQYGANQPEYDLMVADGSAMMKVSVKGSQDGAWGLTQSYVKKAQYHAAVEVWLARHKAKTIFCFVQFKEVTINEMPRLYLATPAEIATVLRSTGGESGSTTLYEDHTWTKRARAAGTQELIPVSWRFTEARARELLALLNPLS